MQYRMLRTQVIYVWNSEAALTHNRPKITRNLFDMYFIPIPIEINSRFENTNYALAISIDIGIKYITNQIRAIRFLILRERGFKRALFYFTIIIMTIWCNNSNWNI